VANSVAGPWSKKARIPLINRRKHLDFTGTIVILKLSCKYELRHVPQLNNIYLYLFKKQISWKRINSFFITK